MSSYEEGLLNILFVLGYNQKNMDRRWRHFNRYQEKALFYNQKNRIQWIEFSGPTYQLEIIDEDGQIKVWPFIKFGEDGEIQDYFCSCDKGDEMGMCEHLAAAIMRIYAGTETPLHQRFEGSLWNNLAKIFAEDLGYDPLVFKEQGDIFIAKDPLGTHTITLEIQGEKEQQRFASIVLQRKKENEENSLKFSNLSSEDIRRWREGRPSPEVRYHLSFWFDLAAWWMELQDEKEKYEIFLQEIEGLPLFFEIKYKRLRIQVLLQKKDLIFLIPSFNTINFPLRVKMDGRQNIKHLHYLPEKQSFYLERGETHDKEIEGGIVLGDWRYVSGYGFIYQGEESSLKKSHILKEEMGSFLSTQKEFIKRFLIKEKIHFTRIEMKYKMRFDSLGTWHFEGYLFQEEDLNQENAAFFGTWAYLPYKGFYPLSFSLFTEFSSKIPSHLVSEFVDQHQIWLNTQPGFQVHLAGIENQMSYEILADGSLEFKWHIEKEENRDFGQWVYVEEEGFFAKFHPRLGPVIRPGLKIPYHKVGDFLKNHREELETLPHFFSEVLPIKERGISIRTFGEDLIIITPEYTPTPEFEEEVFLFYGDFVFSNKLKFCELPLKMRLPPQCLEVREIRHEAILPFLRLELPSLMPWVLFLDPLLRKPHQMDFEIAYLARNPKGGIKAKIYLRTEYGVLNLGEVVQALSQKQKMLFSSAGFIDFQDEALNWIKTAKISFEPNAETLSLSTMEFLRLDAALNFLFTEEKTAESSVGRSLLFELRHFQTLRSYDLAGLKSQLRPYQKIGLDWLWFLYQNDLAGILCDEMGLGKTHQAMAFLTVVSNQKEKKEGLFLVVCPTSVIYHWQDKLSQFLPKLPLFLFHGVDRNIKNFPKKGIVLTSYGICRSEQEFLRKITFEVAIFDELQIAKNPQSQIHKSLLHITAKMKLGLTGTPIENNLRELKSLFDVVLPHYMPKESVYRNFFINPIEKEKDEEKKGLLKQLIRPFILRRKKQDVLTELPAKTEEKALCVLSAEQRELYQKVLQESGRGVIQDLKEPKKNISYVHIFSLLSKLKQICNHPALLSENLKNYKLHRSGKWELFVELIKEAKESGQKVVVFSQYLKMLDIMELFLQEQGWGYAQLRGSTIDRKEQIQRFQEDPNCSIFLGSLGAAGLGIDLTAGSTVILYDRWWNAARENQAIDRVHRMGQKWGVQVFKLVTKGTLEENIDKMIHKKSILMEEVVEEDDQDDIKRLTRKELLELLTFIPYEEEDDLWEDK